MGDGSRNKITAGDIEDLTVSVEQLTEEARLLRISLDELRDDVVWAARQVLGAGDAVVPNHLRRQYDPLATEAADDATFNQPTFPRPSEPPMASGADEAETSSYCCDRPNLQWHGDPDAPGVLCEHCGYIVAESGSVVMWCEEGRSPSEKKPDEPIQRQSNLF